ncbi:MAG TPA: hypothetical protein VHH52_07590, partial [Pseudonocardiaceae bacterium]|nr:hypothetical protein [Pseudonocardiaceae bacterium]
QAPSESEGEFGELDRFDARVGGADAPASRSRMAALCASIIPSACARRQVRLDALSTTDSDLVC